MSAWYHQEGCVYVRVFVRIEMCFVGGCHHASTYLWPGFNLFLPQLSLWQLRKHTSEKKECDFPKITLMTNGRVRPGPRRSVMRPAACWLTKWGAFCDIFWNRPLFNGVMDLAEGTLVTEWFCMRMLGAVWMTASQPAWQRCSGNTVFVVLLYSPNSLRFWFYHQTISFKFFFNVPCSLVEIVWFS